MEYSVFTKDYGLLTKEIQLESNEVIKDASQCRMANGSVQTVSVDNLLEFREFLKGLNQNQAIALGITESAYGKSVRIVKKGLEAQGAISRSNDYFTFKDAPALMLLDYDPPKGGQALSIGDVYVNLIKIVPELVGCEVLALGSTSSGVYLDGGAPPASSGGIHLYVVVDNGSRIPDLGKILAERYWLMGLGRYDVSKSGSLLQRTLFDEAVHSPERLIFEAAPALGTGLKQLPRAFKHWPGGLLETANIKGLTSAEEATVEALKAEAKVKKQPEADAIRAAHNKTEVARLVSQGVSKNAAREQIEKSNNGTLTGSHPLQFAGLQMLTVNDLLRDPARYHEWECIDPHESLDLNAPYRAKLFNNPTGLLINSFRSGGRIYRLDKIEIKLDRDNPIGVFDQMESVINTGSLPDVFVWGGVLSHIGNDGTVRNLTAVSAPVIIGRLVRFYNSKLVKNSWERVWAELPDKLWKAFLEKGSWKIPKLEGIVHSPYFFDGDVLQTRGYNPKSGLYLTRDFGFRGIKNAILKDANKGLAHLRELLAGFPFQTKTDEAVALSMMLTAVQRATLETAPLFAVTACTPGSGKTQLVTGIASLMTGDIPAVHGFKDNEQETAKMLMSALLQGAPNIIIDNVKLGVGLGGDALCAVLSSPLYVDRELGFSRIRKVSTRVLMSATGNNLKLASDATRRSVMIRIDAKCERPELRKFEKNFVTICKEQREAILRSVLAILSAYDAAGSPEVEHIKLGTFETWSDQICRPLIWLGIPDPALGLARADADEGVAGLGELLTIWRHEINFQRVTTAEVQHHPGVAEYFRQEFEDKGGVNVRKTGRLLAKYAGRVIDGMRIVNDGTLHRATVWKIELVS